MKKIAIVDDEHDIVNILEVYLNRSNKFDITTFVNPIKALEHIKSNEFDLVLLDIMMPQMDGMNVLKEIKKFNPNIKVVMMTAFSTQDKMIECERIGADNYVTKPFISLRDVQNKIFDLLEV